VHDLQLWSARSAASRGAARLDIPARHRLRKRQRLYTAFVIHRRFLRPAPAQRESRRAIGRKSGRRLVARHKLNPLMPRETLINLSFVVPSGAEMPVFGQFREVEEPFGKLRAGSAFVFSWI